MTNATGRWHGPKHYLGFHHDLHASSTDDTIGTRCSVDELMPMLQMSGAQFIQTDSKGHTGYATWFSQTPDASVPAGLKLDALAQWREATARMGVPLHAHYSGIWDEAAGAKHPEWCVLDADGAPIVRMLYPQDRSGDKPRAEGTMMCIRSDYVEQLMIPQLLEMIDRYGVDGFWVDGDLWAARPCYCARCMHAFSEETGIQTAPKTQDDPNWKPWWEFTRRSFDAYVTRYCDAVHQHKPGVLVCSNTLQTFADPGEPKVPTDWVSGDTDPMWGVDRCRCESRFRSTRGKHWDVMLLDFYSTGYWLGQDTPSVTKPVQMLLQEISTITALGGNVQICDPPWMPCGVRTGQHVPWRMRRVQAVGKYVNKRRKLCQGTNTFPQIAVLHSEYHARANPKGPDLRTCFDLSPVEGAVYGLLENQFGVDILDEWALMPVLGDFPVVVVPEQNFLSDTMVSALQAYVLRGGKLFVSGSELFHRFGEAFLGVSEGSTVKDSVFHLPAADGSTPVYSPIWRLVEPSGAATLRTLGETPLLDEYLLPQPGATLHRYGKGKVLYIPCDLFRDFAHKRYGLTRALIGELMRDLAGHMEIEVSAPACVDVILRRHGEQTIIHLINRVSGIPNQPNNCSIDEIPKVGPMTITWRRKTRPKHVRLAYEKGNLKSKFTAGRQGRLEMKLDLLHIHAAIVIE